MVACPVYNRRGAMVPGNLARAAGVERAVVGRPLPDEELVARARRGDASAYEELVRRHAQIAFRTAYLVTGSAADAEEAAQDGFVKAHRALGRFRPGAPFRPWLLQIVANEARNRRRSAGRRAALALRAGRGEPLGRRGSASRAGAPRRRGARRAARGARRRSSERDRLVIACRYLLELSEAETAAALGCRPRHRQVAAVAGARAPARRRGGGASRCLTASSSGSPRSRAEVEFPATPDLAPAVAARVAEAGARAGGARAARRSLAGAGARAASCSPPWPARCPPCATRWATSSASTARRSSGCRELPASPGGARPRPPGHRLA